VLDVDLGDEVEVLNRSWRVSGLTSGMTNIVNSVSYVRFVDFALARGRDESASYVLVGSDDPAALAPVIVSATGLTVQTRTEFSSQERQGIKDMSTDLMQIMTLAGFLIGLAVIGLTLYAATLSRIREVGVMKALGATPGRLVGVVLSQAAWTILAALAVALLMALGLGWLMGGAASTFPLVLEASSVARVVIGALALGAVGALAPLVRVARVDPASVFRR
jgi:putative ABC transport system permease protein